MKTTQQTKRRLKSLANPISANYSGENSASGVVVIVGLALVIL